MPQSELRSLLIAEDHDALRDLARDKSGKVLRFLVGRLYSEDEAEKHRAVNALGQLIRPPSTVGAEKIEDLLRRFFWALSDESGAVPFGIPEAIGEVLAVRAEYQSRFLPMLGSMLTEEEMSQTGAIQRGVMWALGRVGSVAIEVAPDAVEVIRAAATGHPDPRTRQSAACALDRIQNGPS